MTVAATTEAKVSGSTYPLKTSYDAKQRALHIMLADVAVESQLSVRGRASHGVE